jgi:hypothetical protein
MTYTVTKQGICVKPGTDQEIICSPSHKVGSEIEGRAQWQIQPLGDKWHDCDETLYNAYSDKHRRLFLVEGEEKKQSVNSKIMKNKDNPDDPKLQPWHRLWEKANKELEADGGVNLYAYRLGYLDGVASTKPQEDECHRIAPFAVVRNEAEQQWDKLVKALHDNTEQNTHPESNGMITEFPGEELPKRIGEDGICPVTKEHCNDECCPPGAICNLNSLPLSSPKEEAAPEKGEEKLFVK